MNTYKVHFKNRDSVDYHAFSYTENGNKVFFHRKEDRTDFESYALTKKVTGIENKGDFEPPSMMIGY